MTSSEADSQTGITPRLQDAGRVVIKVGSSLLIDAANGRLDNAWLDGLAAELARMIARGQKPLVVSSGAIGLGRKYLELGSEQRSLEQQQAAAAAGQVLLAHAYQEVLGRQGIKVAQILLTLGDTENRRRYLNARNTLETLLSVGVVPIINENDSVATEEIRFGDNDRLAARVAVMCSADCLVLLSDVDGLYESDPRKAHDAKLIPLVEKITPELESRAGDSGTAYGSGGMSTKIAAARICMLAGCATVIANGNNADVLSNIDQPCRCTWFVPTTTPQLARKRWIAGSLEPCGTLVVDAGAAQSLRNGKSLLAVGIVEARGQFSRGDAVTISSTDEKELARGLVAYTAEEIGCIMGKHSSEIARLLGYQGRNEVVHRDNLAFLDS